MTRKTSRILALGLLTSSVVVMGLEIWSPVELKDTYAKSSDSLTENVIELEDRIVELESENARLNDEIDRLSEGYTNALSLSDIETSEMSISETNTDQSDETAEAEDGTNDSEEETVQEYTVTVRDGEPSSVVAQQLENFGVIEDRHAFNDYLETNDLAKKVRPGNYVVHSDMDEAALAEAIID